MTERIDSHHHLWRYSQDAYPWITNEMNVLRRDFLPSDIETEGRANHIDGCVVVQAQQTLDETYTLLEHADRHSFLRGVVGWAPISSSRFPSILEELCSHPKLRGLRHVIQDEPDENYILRKDFNLGIDKLAEQGIAYDVLVFAKHLPQTIAFVDRHPQQIFVLDHMGKPDVARQVLSPWKENIRDLAQRENVYCKLSGLLTEAKWNDWTDDQFQPYVDTVMEAFGPARIMMGSDWPVCLLAGSYSGWMQLVYQWTSSLSTDEQDCILGRTAAKVYTLPGTNSCTRNGNHL
jgi:L-fuconolactonase